MISDNKTIILRRVFQWAVLLVFAFFTVLMIRLTLPYLTFEEGVGFMKIKPFVQENAIWICAFYVHVITSCLVLPAGFTQFSAKLLKNHKKLHRSIGKLYIIIVLIFSGPSGLIMGIYANGGIPSKIAFITLAILWMYTTFQAFYTIKNNEIEHHRHFMIRSFALTLSAITLRAWKYLIVFAFRPQPMDAYMIVAWLGWVPNLIIAEIIIRNSASKMTKPTKKI